MPVSQTGNAVEAQQRPVRGVTGDRGGVPLVGVPLMGGRQVEPLEREAGNYWEGGRGTEATRQGHRGN